MRATDWEFRNRAVVFGLIFGLSYPLYNLDRQNAAAALASWLAAKANSNGDAILHGLFALAALLQGAAAFVRTWASAYLRADVVYASRVKSASLVADGPYRLVRNPLYLGNVLMAVAMGSSMSRSGFVFAVLATIAFCYRLIRREERELATSQGEKFGDYLRAVPRLWPALTPRLPAAGSAPRWAKGFGAEAWFWGFALAIAAFSVTLDLRVLLGGAAACMTVFWFTSRALAK